MLQVPGAIEQVAAKIAEEVSGPAAEDVDAAARFPHESVAAFKDARLLSAMVPVGLGGQGASVAEIGAATAAIARHCASSALVFAMHQIEIAYLNRHGNTPELRALLEEVAADQLLLANANSEVGIGGDASRSICAIEVEEGRFRLEKHALAVSYGAYADAILTTARKEADAEATDQVLVVCRKSDLQLEATSQWDPIGLRGTCSNSFKLQASGSIGLVFPDPFAQIAAETGTPVTQVLLGSVWWGLAEAAAGLAHRYVRERERAKVEGLSVLSLRLSELLARLQLLRAQLLGAARHYEELKDDDGLLDWSYGVYLRNLKINASSLAEQIVVDALHICGLAGFQRRSPYSLDRILRDVHGGPIMVNNDRFHEANVEMLRVLRSI